VHEEYGRPLLEVAIPVDELLLIRVRRESADGMNFRVDANLLVPQAHVLRAVDEPPSDRPFRLVTDDHDVAFRPPHVVLQVMQDPAAVTHAAAGDDDRAGLDLVQTHRILRRGSRLEIRQHRPVLAFPEELRLVEMPVDRIDAGRLDPHRAIEKHAPTIEAPVGVVLGHEVQEILRAADGESRDQHVAAALRGLEEDRLQLGEGRIEGAMVAVAVRALEQQEIRLFDLCRILHDRGVAVAQVAAEDQLRTAPPILDPQLDDRGAQDVPGIR